MQGVTLCARLFRPHPALARKLLAVFLPPPGGRLLPAVRIFFVLLLNLTDESALSLTTRDCRSSLPPGGEGGAKRRMRAKSASGTTLCNRLAVVAFLSKKKGFFRGFCCFMCYLSATEIPPAGAPLGAGFAVRQQLVSACDF